MNVVVIRGRLSRPAELRELPSGEQVVQLDVTIPRPGDRAESAPVVWYNAPASASHLDVDNEVVVLGRVKRRFFRAGGATQSRTEVVADRVIPARRAASVRTALAAAVERLASGLEPGQGKAPEKEVRRRSRAG